MGWLNVFTDLETALEYKDNFFPNFSDVKVMALYFDETARKNILDDFKPQSEKMGEIGLRFTLLNAIEEDENEELIGYDYLGIEMDGSFCSFHCHHLEKELSENFDLTLNPFGLFDSDKNSKQVLGFLNDEKNNCEPVPWYLAKTKLVKNL